MTDDATVIPGCGWTPEIGEITGYSRPELGSEDQESGCCAQWGYRTYPGFDYPTVGTVGLCIACLEAPADLLRTLSLNDDISRIDRLGRLAVEVARDAGWRLTDYVDRSDAELLALVRRLDAELDARGAGEHSGDV